MLDSCAGANRAIVDADETVLEAVRGYLATCRSGGMPKELSDKIDAVVADAARLQYFSVALAFERILAMVGKARSQPRSIAEIMASYGRG
jgi:hypothetical protein